MNRRFVLASVLVLGVLVATLFQLKHEVRQLEKNLSQNQMAILVERESLLILKAEWSYLNRPSRIQRLSHSHLALAPLQIRQIGDLVDVPFRDANSTTVSEKSISEIKRKSK